MITSKILRVAIFAWIATMPATTIPILTKQEFTKVATHIFHIGLQQGPLFTYAFLCVKKAVHDCSSRSNLQPLVLPAVILPIFSYSRSTSIEMVAGFFGGYQLIDSGLEDLKSENSWYTAYPKGLCKMLTGISIFGYHGWLRLHNPVTV